MHILILNGANLNLLGKREPAIYGGVSMEDFLASLQQEYKTVTIDYVQSNNETILTEQIQQAENQYNGIIINAGAFTHTSIVISDAIRAICIPVVEVHISNIFSRESYRQKSWLSEVCVGSICGFGLNSYQLAVEGLLLMHHQFRQESGLSD
ncbi:MAG: type II 3-dehydroquinate dehydratase [Bacteroidales bacterium]|jgi:3-dehydroquinate dehydratase-2|nr:type II 3-dehydroquinate dehydratase [Bacteroidales bacterium]